MSAKEKKQTYPESELMNREEAISRVLDMIGPDAVYLATTGRATRELHEHLLQRRWTKGNEFLNVGAMGHLSSVALGMATACPQKQIVIFDGDAAAVMHMGSMATIGRYPCPNILHIVLNNGVNESVGGQPSAGNIINLTLVAEACGYVTPGNYLTNSNEVKKFLGTSYNGKPRFVDLHIRQGIRPDMPKLSIDHHIQKNKLMKFLK